MDSAMIILRDLLGFLMIYIVCAELSFDNKQYCKIEISRAIDAHNEKTFEIKMKGKAMFFNVKRRETMETRHSFLLTHSRNNSQLILDKKHAQIFQGVSKCGHAEVTGFFKGGFFNGIVDVNENTYLIEEHENCLNKSSLKTILSTIEKLPDRKSSRLNSTTIATRFDSRQGDVKCPPLNDTAAKRYEISRQTIVQKFIRICTVELIADHTFYEEFGPNRDRVVDKMFKHISLADILLRRTDFDGNGVPDGIGLLVRKVTVYKDNASLNYHLKNTEVAEDFLYDLSKWDNDVCLVVAFCHRIFEGKTLGVAFIPNNSDPTQYGGICEKRVRFADGWYRKMNVVAISTKMHTGKRVPDSMTSSTVIHEIGHAFGAPHDDQNGDCSASADQGGPFIMHPNTLEGTDTNNFYFSSCSINVVNKVIQRRKWCFETFPNPSLCGNGIKEEGEECDCGIRDVCHMFDHCCNAPNKTSNSPKGCTYKRHLGYQCSAKTDPCCTEKCLLQPKKSQRKCSYTVGLCSYYSVCDGKTASCTGNKSSDISCEAAACVRFGLKTCLCPEDDCKVCCFSKNGTCGYFIRGTTSISLPYGSVCAGGKGSCDHVGKCSMNNSNSERILFYLYILIPIITMLFICCGCCVCCGIISRSPLAF